VLIAFKGANIRMWRFKPEWKSSDDSGWRDYGDGELEIFRIGTSGCAYHIYMVMVKLLTSSCL